LGFVCLFYLTDRPQDAKWLAPDERDELRHQIETEAASRVDTAPWWRAICRPNVLLLSTAFWFANVAGYGFIFWLPGVLKEIIRMDAGPADAISALPFGLAMVSTWLTGRSSDRTGERKAHAIVPMLTAAMFFALTAIPGQPAVLLLIWLSLTGATVFAWNPAFWVLPTLVSARSSRAASIGFINSAGNLGGFFGPAITGLLISRLHSHLAIVLLVSLSYAASAVLILTVRTGGATPAADSAGLQAFE
jgi:ACS family tartrate transporter-like MFS transporter